MLRGLVIILHRHQFSPLSSSLLECSGVCSYTDCMKIKKFTIELKVQPKVRQPFAPLTKKFKNKKQYNRRDFKLAFA
jgi:hypothetical protein